MSYMICRMQKYKKSDIKGAEIHDLRLSENSKNIDIVKGLSHLNFDLHNGEAKVNYLSKWKEIISEHRTDKKTIRKDAVCLNQFLVTSDKAFFEDMNYDEMKSFFQESYEVLSERYGKENVISAIVHLDETTPHMHFNLVPLRDGTLSSKAIFDREELRALQDTIWDRVGYPRGLLRGEKREEKVKNIPVMEFKKQTLEKLDREIGLKTKKLKVVNNAFETIEELESIETKKLPFGSGVIVDPEDYSKLFNKAVEGFKALIDTTGLFDENKALKSKIKGLEKRLSTIDDEWETKIEEKDSYYLAKTLDLDALISQKNSEIKNLQEKYVRRKEVTDRLYHLMSINPKIKEELGKASDKEKRQIEIEQEKSRDRGMSM